MWGRSFLLACTTVMMAGLASFAAAGNTGTANTRNDVDASRSEPVAVVESVSNPAAVGVQFMDYLYRDQELDLGSDSTLKLLYLESCRVETIRGGKIRIGASQSHSREAKISHERVQCSQPETVTTARARRAGAAVVRDTDQHQPGMTDERGKDRAASANTSESPGYDADHGDADQTVETRWHIRGLHPVMKWPASNLTAPYRLEVTSYEEVPPRLIWKGETHLSHLRYPDEAPALQVDTPYRVRIVDANNRAATAVFVSENKDQGSDESLEALVPLRP